MSLYTYVPLRHNDIRLVYLHPPIPAPIPTQSSDSDSDTPVPDSRISIDIKVAELGRCQYSALSYVWGFKAERSEAIEVRGHGSNKIVKITPSLHTALRHFQSSQTKVLWIDALCINQDDINEQSKQVMRMADIYSKASNVIIWLGEADRDSDLAMKFIQEISVRELDRLAGSESTGESWRALAKLMRRPWFTRRWIIQEVAFSQKAELWCGSWEVPWTQFAEAVTLFESKIDDINQLFRDLKKSEMKGNKFRTVAKYAVPIALFAGGLAAAVFSRGRIQPKQWMGGAATNWNRSFQTDMRDRHDWNVSVLRF